MQPHASFNRSKPLHYTATCYSISPLSKAVPHLSLITCPLTVVYYFFLDAQDPDLAKELEEEIFQYRFHTFADTTKATYRTQRSSYLWFCARMGYPALPAQSAHLCQYVAYLARSLKRS